LAAGVALGILAVPPARADTFGSGANQFTMEFSSIGHAGNAADTAGSPNPAGAVDYAYRIGTFEVSRDMILKANNEGGLGITMADLTAYGGNGPNRPATELSWNEAARFVNWLNTSSGYQPAYKFATQPGQAGYHPEEQASFWEVGDPGYGYNGANPYRNNLALYFLPTTDEWYKAAFFDPVSGQYFRYATGSDSPPVPIAGGTAPGTAVWDQAAGGPADVSNAGGLSPFGTMGQSGNVWEWNEKTLPSSGIPGGNIRGGSWLHNTSFDLGSLSPAATYPDGSNFSLGFRVTAVPEPESLPALVGLALLGWRVWTRRLPGMDSSSKPS